MIDYGVASPLFSYKRLYSYLLKELLLLFFLSLALFTFILVIGNLGKMADQVINKGVGLGDIFLLMAYLSPKFFTFTLPMAFLLSSVVALGRLASENEVLALKASGVNLFFLYVPVAALGITVFLAGFLNNSFLLSKGSKAFQDTLVSIFKKGFSIEDKEGIFNDSIKGVVIYIDKVDTKSKELSGIVISDDRDEAARMTVTAETGKVSLDANTLDMLFQLRNGSLQRWEKSSDTYRNLSFKDYKLPLNLSSLIPKEWRKPPYEMDVGELRKALIKARPEDKYDLVLEIYKKVSIPFSIFAFTLLTVPLGIRRKGGGLFLGVVFSLVIFVAYYMLSALSENMGRTLGVWPGIISFAPNIVFAVIGLFLLRDLNGEGHDRISARFRRLWEPFIAKTR
jgi:lipopolysaccharide export system permease protein